MNSLSTTKDAIIIGGGISGLSLAYYLKHFNLDSIVIEKEPRTGGFIQTKQIGSYQIEMGPQTILLEPEIFSLIKELNLENELLYPPEDQKARFLANPLKKTLLELPSSFSAILSGKFISLIDIFNLLKDLFSKHTPIKIDDISIGDLFACRLGRALTENILAAPFVGVWAASIWNLSARSVLPKAFDAFLNGTSVLKALIGEAKRKKTSGGTKIVNLRGGLQSLTSALEKTLDGNLILGEEISKISRLGLDWEIEIFDKKYRTKNLIIACNPKLVLDKIYQENLESHGSLSLNSAIEKIKAKLELVSYSPIGVLQFSFSKTSSPLNLTGFGALIPPKYCKGLLGMIFSSCLFPSKHDASKNVVTCFCGGSIKPEYSNILDQSVREDLLTQASDLLNLNTKPLVISQTYYENAIPIYEPKHFKIENSISDFEDSIDGLFIHSNLKGGVGIPARVRNSMNLACKIANKMLDVN